MQKTVALCVTFTLSRLGPWHAPHRQRRHACKERGILVAYREWSSADPNARKILAALVSVRNGIGRFKRPDGSTFDYPLNKLSTADRKSAEDAAK